MSPLSEAPMIRLLDHQARRRGFDRYRRWTMFCVLLFLAPAVSAAFTDSGPLRTYLFTLAAVMGLLVPLAQLAGDASLLASLRRGGCLDELLGTPTTSAQIVDQVATWSILSVLRLGLAVILPVLGGLLLIVPTRNQQGVLLGALLWVPAVAVAVWVGSMGVQAAVAWSDGRRGQVPALGLLALLGGAALLALAPSGRQGLALAGLAALGLGLLARSLARAGLERPLRGRPARHRQGPHRPSRHRNPVAWREASRRRTGPSWWGAVAILALTAAAFSSHGLSLAELPWLYGTVALTALVVVQPLRASLGTVSAVAAERDAGTLEPLAMTGVRPRDFLDGWAVATAGPLLVESLALMLVAVAVGAVTNLLPFLFEVLDLLVTVVFGAYLGLLVSTLPGGRRDAWSALFLGWVASSMLLSLLPGTVSAYVTVALGAEDLALVTVLAGGLLDLGFSVAALVLVRCLALVRVRALFAPRHEA